MQAIHTHFIGPSNVRGSRVKARADAGSVTIPWDHALDIEANHAAACRALVDKLGWNYGDWFGGSAFDKGYCWVCKHPNALSAAVLAKA